MSWAFWGGVLAALAILFRWMYKLAAKIEKAEVEEQQWLEWLNNIYQTQPWNAYEAQRRFNEKFGVK